MAPSLTRACVSIALALACSSAGCARLEQPQEQPPHAAQTSGTLQVDGLRAPVTVTRDQWGIPHIAAANTDDLFFAQGFVQAQDRLFQMDLWKRSVQGRLSEVLGANFIQRDSMTRRIQFRGDLEREWASYGPDARRIAIAFTSGINAWVRIARRNPPEEFALAGWQPEFWRPEDLLNRTDAFMASTGALTELIRARLIASVGLEKANALLPSPGTEKLQPDPEVDLSAITFVVSDAVRRIGTPPFFLTLAGKVSDAPRPGQHGVDSSPVANRTAPNASTQATRGTPATLPASVTSRARIWVQGGRQTSSGPSVGIEMSGALVVPSRTYLVHLTAPGWNVIGVARPWLPGVIAGHNERIAWAMTPLPIDTQDIAVERVNPADPHQVWHEDHWVDMAVDYERVAVKGRDQPVAYERLYTSNGVVVAQDKEGGLVYTLRWTGTEPGGAGELAALNLGQADSWSGFREGLDRWIAPPSEFFFADVDGAVGFTRAGLIPKRSKGRGATPTSAWSNNRIWTDFARLSDAGGVLERSAARDQADSSTRKVLELLETAPEIRALPREFDAIRKQIRAANSPQLMLRLFYTIRRNALEGTKVPADLRDEVLYAVDPANPDTDAPKAMFAGDANRASLLVSALKTLADASKGEPRTAPVVFPHPLAVFDTSRRRFDVWVVPGSNQDSGQKTEYADLDAGWRPQFRASFTPGVSNRSIAINSPGQSGSPASAHYEDLASTWMAGGDVPLAFNQSNVSSGAGDVLTLEPGDRRVDHQSP